jgi:hypothetical protein
MPKKDYIPNDDAGKAALFTHVATTLPQHFVTLGITAVVPGVVAQAQDAAAFAYLCTNQQTLQGAAQQATAAKNRLRDGDALEPNVPVSLAFPSVPATVPASVLPGVTARFRTFANWLKNLPPYTNAIGEILQIVGDDSAATDPGTVKPLLPLKISGGQVLIGWTWQGLSGQLDSIEIQVDRGTGTFVFLTIDTRPGYVDTEPFPATPAKWKYRAIYRENDTRIGLWSDVAEISVG